MIQLDAVLKDNVPGKKKNIIPHGSGERESPQLSGIKRKFAAFLHEAEWLLFVVVDGFVYVFVLLLRQYFSVTQCFLLFSVSFPRNIYYC